MTHPGGGRPRATQEGGAAPKEEPHDALHPRAGCDFPLSPLRTHRQVGRIVTMMSTTIYGQVYFRQEKTNSCVLIYVIDMLCLLYIYLRHLL